ncbi:MAG: retron system putative HNH endonuclease [Verrucomicrobiota bacterium]|jgi:uncharacterized protein (TIGR02646 family)
MRTIIKGHEPASLTQHRLKPHADYDNYADKDGLRQALAAEQRGLCCYCLSRVRPVRDAMKIEHWHSQNSYPSEQLDYDNLLGACLGGDGQSPIRQTCDTRKGDRELSRNPANGAHHVEELIRFEASGRIVSDDPVFDAEMNEVLNLNTPFLQNNRKATLDAFTKVLVKRSELSRITLERWLREWSGEAHTGELEPFCQVIVYWLRKRLARA